jgi:O-antigen/teichoic acid export membrane protein
VRQGAVWTLAATAVGTLGTLLVTPKLIAALGVADFGLYLLVLTLTSSAAFLDLGLLWAATGFFAADVARHRRDDLTARFYTLSCFLLAISAGAGGGAVALGPWLAQTAGATVDSGFRFVLALASASIAIALLCGLFQSLLRGAQRFNDVGRVSLVTTALSPLAALLAVQWWGDLTAVVISHLVANLATLALLVRSTQRHPRLLGPPGPWQGRRLSEMLAVGGWATVARLTMLIMLHLDRLLIALVGSVTGLVAYTVAAQLAARVNLLASTSTSLYFARVSWLQAADRGDDVRRQHETMRSVVLVATLALALPLATFGPAFVQEWLGPEMKASAGLLLIILVAGHGVVSVTSVDAAVLEASGRADLTAKTMAAWAAFSIAVAACCYASLNAAAIAAAVALWLSGVGITTAFLRWRVLGRFATWAQTRVWGGLAATLALSLVMKALFEPLVTSLPAVLVAMLISAGVVTITGLFTILDVDQRRCLLSWPRTAPLSTAPSALV